MEGGLHSLKAPTRRQKQATGETTAPQVRQGVRWLEAACRAPLVAGAPCEQHQREAPRQLLDVRQWQLQTCGYVRVRGRSLRRCHDQTPTVARVQKSAPQHVHVRHLQLVRARGLDPGCHCLHFDRPLE